MGVIALAKEASPVEEELQVIHEFKFPVGWIVKRKTSLVLIQPKAEDFTLLDNPIECTALVFDENNQICGRMLSFFSNFQKRKIEVFCDDSTMGRTDAFERFLIRNGVKVAVDQAILGRRTSASLLRSYLLSCEPELRILRRSVSGWVPNRDGFLLGTEVLGSKKYVSEYEEAPFKTHGSIEDWIEHCALPTIDSPMWVTSILSAFAAPMLSLLGLERCSGGFHFYGHSSSGKTIGLELAAGIYGQAPHPWYLTGNGLEGTAAKHSDRLLVLDEIKQANPKDVMNSIYMLSNRQGKVRMTDKIRVRKSLTWQLLYLSSGETSIEEVATRAKSEYYEGQALRFLSIPMIRKLYPIKFIRKLEKSIQCLHGAVGRGWLDYLLTSNSEQIPYWRKTYEQIVDEYVKSWASEDPRINRILQRLAILETAAGIAQLNGFLPDEYFDPSPDEESGMSIVRNSLFAVLQSWCDGSGISRINGTLSDTKKAAKRVLEAINIAIANRWLVPFENDEFTQAPGFKTLGFIDETSTDEKTVFLLDSVLKNNCIPPGIRTFTKELAALGILKRDENNKDSKGKPRLKTRMKTIQSTLLTHSDYRIDRSVQSYAFNLKALEQYTNS